MSDYVEGEDCWKKVKHTNLSDAQANIAALQARIEKQAAEIERLREENKKLELMWENASHGQALGVHHIVELQEALQAIAANTCCDRCQEAALVAKEALLGGSKP